MPTLWWRTTTTATLSKQSKDTAKKEKITDKVLLYFKKLGEIFMLCLKSPHDGYLELCKLLHPAKVGMQHLWLNCKVFVKKIIN